MSDNNTKIHTHTTHVYSTTESHLKDQSDLSSSSSRDSSIIISCCCITVWSHDEETRSQSLVRGRKKRRDSSAVHTTSFQTQRPSPRTVHNGRLFSWSSCVVVDSSFSFLLSFSSCHPLKYSLLSCLSSARHPVILVVRRGEFSPDFSSAPESAGDSHTHGNYRSLIYPLLLHCSSAAPARVSFFFAAVVLLFCCCCCFVRSLDGNSLAVTCFAAVSLLHSQS